MKLRVRRKGLHKLIAVFVLFAIALQPVYTLAQSHIAQASDTTPPVVTIHSPENGEVYQGVVDVVASIVDTDLSHYWFTVTKDDEDIKLPNTNLIMYTDEFFESTIASLTDPGNYTVMLGARDKAGNKDNVKSVAVVKFTLNADNTPPVVTVITGEWSANTIQLSAQVTGETNPVTYEWVAPIEVDMSDLTSSNPIATVPKITKTYQLQLTVSDRVGNQTIVPVGLSYVEPPVTPPIVIDTEVPEQTPAPATPGNQNRTTFVLQPTSSTPENDSTTTEQPTDDDRSRTFNQGGEIVDASSTSERDIKGQTDTEGNLPQTFQNTWPIWLPLLIIATSGLFLLTKKRKKNED